MVGYRHVVDTIFIVVDVEQAQRERLRFHETATKSVVCYKPIPPVSMFQKY